MPKRRISQGETLSSIARDLGLKVPDILAANLSNPRAIPDPKNPNLILAGGILTLPDAPPQKPPAQAGEPAEAIPIVKDPLAGTKPAGILTGEKTGEQAKETVAMLNDTIGAFREDKKPSEPVDTLIHFDEGEFEPETEEFGLAQQIKSSDEFFASQLANINSRFDNVVAGLDNLTKNVVADIKSTYVRLRDARAEQGRRALASLRTGQIRRGGRFTPTITADLLDFKANQTLEKIEELSREEQRLVSEAVEASRTKQLDAVFELSEKILNIRKQRVSEISAFQNLLINQEKNERSRTAELRAQEKFEMDKITFEQRGEQDLVDRLADLREEQIEDFENLIDSLENVDPSTLSPKARKEIENKATSAGLLPEIVFEGLRAKFLKADLGRLLDEATLRKRGQEIEEGEVGKGDDFNKARTFVADNPEASRDELFLGLRQNTDLAITDINTLLDERGIEKPREAEIFLSDKNIRDVAIAITKAMGKEDALRAVAFGTININKKNIDLSAEQIAKIKASIEKEFPKGRTFFQKVLPGGK